MKTTLEKIRNQIIGAPRYFVSPELDRKVQGALGWQKLSPAFELEPEEGLLSPAITQWLMKSLKQYAVAVAAIAIMLGGTWFYTENSYAYHLGKAKAALADLQSVLGGKPIAQNPFMAQAFAEDSVSGSTVNEAQVVDLTQTVVQETEAAIEIIENKTDPVAVQEALAEVVVVQDQSVPVLVAAAEAVTTAEATQAVAAAIETTTTDQAVVAQAQDFVAQATANSETQVAIDIQTASDTQATVTEDEKKSDEERLAEAKAEYQEAKALIEKLKASGADEELIAKLQSKLDKVVAAFEEGKIGRAHGLSTALAAQGKHQARKEAREKKEREDKDDEDKDDKDEEESDKEDEEEKGEDEEGSDEQKASEAKANVEEAKALIEQAKVAGADQDDIEKIQTKIDRAQTALDEKKSQAYGLSVAALAEGKKLLRGAKEDKDDEEDKGDGSDDGDKDEGDDEDENEEPKKSTVPSDVEEGPESDNESTEGQRERSERRGEDRDSEGERD